MPTLNEAGRRDLNTTIIMQLTPDERKILNIANTSKKDNQNNSSKLKIARLGLILGVIAGSMLEVYGAMGLVYHKPDALIAISYGLLLIGFLTMMYGSLKFKITALSLIRKLTNEQKEI